MTFFDIPLVVSEGAFGPLRSSRAIGDNQWDRFSYRPVAELTTLT